MPTCRSLALVALVSSLVADAATASPITFAFSGNLDEAINGSFQFSGSLTLNGDPTVVGSPNGSVTEGGGDVSMTLNIGGQKFDVVNQANPLTSTVSFTAALSEASRMNPPGYRPMRLKSSRVWWARTLRPGSISTSPSSAPRRRTGSTT